LAATAKLRAAFLRQNEKERREAFLKNSETEFQAFDEQAGSPAKDLEPSAARRQNGNIPKMRLRGSLSSRSKKWPDATQAIENERSLNQQKQDGGEAKRDQDGHRQA
jgi:hypothetical protein